MTTELIILPDAENDLAEAYAWYQKRQSGLGGDFLSCVETRMQSIKHNPEQFEIVHEDYHRALVRRFPYAIFYEYSGDVATV
ncbi:MAG: type II toxin-antitoxin system RelE/ParE family toxin, partial [Planctomycetes bacterium]|nr:type II toxin-antitoxin system RelE/ParE family toxin [Planctomycetota bacterium]